MQDDPRPMDCDRLRELLVEHVDGLLGAADAAGARAHLAGCAPCRLLQEEVRRNFAAMDAWEDEELPAGAWQRLEARLPAGPVPRIAAPLSGAAPRRPWIRLALPYAAGLATAAAAALVLVFLPGDPPPAKGGPAPAVSAPADRRAAPAASPAVANRAAPRAPGLRPGERRLSFEDHDAGVIRTLALPGGLDPSKVMLVDTPPVEVPASGEPVR